MWRHGGLQFGNYIAINVSPWQLVDLNFAQLIKTTLAEHGVEPAQLLIEVTETGLLLDLKTCAAMLVELRALGVKVALDDFGTGYSSLNYRHELPLDILKIDRSFVARIDAAGGHALIGSIILMTHRLQMQVVAEGVETTAQQHALIGLDCDLFQGFLICPPVDTATLRLRYAK